MCCTENDFPGLDLSVQGFETYYDYLVHKNAARFPSIRDRNGQYVQNPSHRQITECLYMAIRSVPVSGLRASIPEVDDSSS